MWKGPSKFFPYAGAVIMLALGLLLLLVPEVVITVFPPLIGAVMIVIGGTGIANVAVMHKRLLDPGMKLVSAIVNLMVGVVFIVKRDISLAFLAILFGMYVLVSSGITLSDTLQNQRENKRLFWGGILESLVGLVLGALLMFAPFSQRSIWSRVLAIYFLIAAAHGFLFSWKITHNMPKPPDAEQEEADG